MSFGEHDLFYKICFVGFLIFLVIGSLLGIEEIQFLLVIYIIFLILMVIMSFKRREKEE